jgi:alkanesulfonate monooxygenase SsuD/methylene tetrahydromethanopterin reductase-like flavin-dependent oxidoreductase (luciferase family)
MPRKILIALPAAMLEQIDFVATAEHRTRSDLVREALRRYLQGFRGALPVKPSEVIEAPPQAPLPPPIVQELPGRPTTPRLY